MGYLNCTDFPDNPKIKLNDVLGSLGNNIKTINIDNNFYYYLMKKKKVIMPEYLTPKLAYFIGYLQGDGHVGKDNKRISFTDESRQHLENINVLSSILFNIKGMIYVYRPILSLKPVYRLDLNRNILNSFLHNYWGLPRGVKKGLRIPKLMLENKEILKFYLMALFDADGTLPKHPETCKQLFLDITLKDKTFIEQIRQCLRLFGVETLKPYCRIAKSPNSDYISRTWELRIRRRADIKKFLNEIGFSHPYKGVRADKLLTHLGQ